MASNKYYDEWDEPRLAKLLRHVTYLTVKDPWTGARVDYTAPPDLLVWITGQMTEDTREMYGGRRLHNTDIGALIEEGVQFVFVDTDV